MEIKALELPTPPPRVRMRVLIAEDQGKLREWMSKQLHARSAETLVAKNGLDAIWQTEMHRPEIAAIKPAEGNLFASIRALAVTR